MIRFIPNSSNLISEGGEGEIYEYKAGIVKIFKPTVDLEAKKRKVDFLIGMTLPDCIAYPVDIVVNQNDEFIGYYMKKFDGNNLSMLANKKFTSMNNISTNDILKILVDLKNTILSLHTKGIYIGDLNDKNVLFNSNNEICLIDCDSWSINGDRCTVAMDLFKDPYLTRDNFNADTDLFAYSVIAWKCLTRIHPFGGTTNPDMDILTRMSSHISVIGNNVKIPRIAKSWKGMPPDLISEFKENFETQTRNKLDLLDKFYQNLAFCNVDHEYYFNGFTTCPFCDVNAKIQSKAQSAGVSDGVPIYPVYDQSIIKMMISEDMYLGVDNKIHCLNFEATSEYGVKIHFLNDGILVKEYNDRIIVNCKSNIFNIPKRFQTNIVIDHNNIYFISPQGFLTKTMISDFGNNFQKICKCSNTAFFNVKNGNYCVVNSFHNGTLIIETNDGMVNAVYHGEIINYGIHYDVNNGSWLVVIEDEKSTYKTYILNCKSIVYETDQIKYSCNLGNVCISNDVVFIPNDGYIRGFSYKGMKFKDFTCDFVSTDSNLQKRKNKFLIVNSENVYIFG